MTAGALVLLLALAAAGPDEGAEAPLEPGVSSSTVDGVAQTVVQLPSPVLDIAFPRRGDGRRDLVLLLAADAEGDEPTGDPEDREAATVPRLMRIDLAEERIEDVPLPADAEAVGLDAADLDGDGREELIVAEGGRLLRTGPEGRWLELSDSAPSSGPKRRLLWFARDRWLEARGPEDPLWVVEPEGLRLFGPGEDGRWSWTDPVGLPVSARRDGSRLEVRTPSVFLAGRAADGRFVFATLPEPRGPQRLRALLLDPAAPEGRRRVECWMRLPGPEEVLESRYLIVDGEPALAVATRPLGKLSFFDEKKLRLFRLEPDRTRRGHPPFFAVETRANLWQPFTFHVLDVEGDRRDELVLGYWKGLKGDRLVLDAYLRDDEGGFRRSPGKTGFDLKEADRSLVLFGRDLNGDGRPDLVVGSEAGLRLHAGQEPGSSGGDLVARRPAARTSVAASRGHVEVTVGSGGIGGVAVAGADIRPFALDVDGDGANELVVVLAEKGAGRVVILRFPGAATSG